ncbi:hypothetical protein ES703_46257 [subsurface metagenome]
MKRYISLKEAVEITGFGDRALKLHIRKGRLKCCKPKYSNKIAFTEKQLRDFMNDGDRA